MDLFVKCIVIAVISAISAVMLKRYLAEISLLVLVITAAILLSIVSGLLENVFEFVNSLSQAAGISRELLSPVFKVFGIAILAKIAGDICKDAGAGTLVTVIELCAGAIATILSMPLFNAVLGLITRM